MKHLLLITALLIASRCNAQIAFVEPPFPLISVGWSPDSLNPNSPDTLKPFTLTTRYIVGDTIYTYRIEAILNKPIVIMVDKQLKVR